MVLIQFGKPKPERHTYTPARLNENVTGVAECSRGSPRVVENWWAGVWFVSYLWDIWKSSFQLSLEISLESVRVLNCCFSFTASHTLTKVVFYWDQLFLTILGWYTVVCHASVVFQQLLEELVPPNCKSDEELEYLETLLLKTERKDTCHSFYRLFY